MISTLMGLRTVMESVALIGSELEEGSQLDVGPVKGFIAIIYSFSDMDLDPTAFSPIGDLHSKSSFPLGSTPSQQNWYSVGGLLR